MLETALSDAGLEQEVDTIFLAHVGVFPGRQLPTGLTLAHVDKAKLPRFVRTRLMAFSDTDCEPEHADIENEVSRLGAEMLGSGRGLLATVDGEPAGVLWSYEEAQDVWISLLGVRQPFREQGIAHALLRARTADAYSRGFRSVVINVNVDNRGALRLYRKLGFRDKVYHQWRYRKTLKCAFDIAMSDAQWVAALI